MTCTFCLVFLVLLIFATETWSFHTRSLFRGRVSIGGAPFSPPLHQSKFAEDASLYEISVDEVHGKLEDTVIRHLHTLDRFDEHNTIAAHTKEAFAEALSFVDKAYSKEEKSNKFVILDSGCGKGLSTFRLAQMHPGIPVIGVDRSFNRLSKNGMFNSGDNKNNSSSTSRENANRDRYRPPNALLVRAELADFWSLVLKESDWLMHSHYLLYPNPYPKARHLGRRWHGHAVFPALLALGGAIRVRSNWHIYCEEMRLATTAAMPSYPAWFASEARISSGPYKYSKDAQQLHYKEGGGGGDDLTLVPAPMTHFERKYMHLGVALHETRVDLPLLDRTQRMQVMHHLLLQAKATAKAGGAVDGKCFELGEGRVAP
jgi:tRNA G46 methylase TrmB